MQTHREMIVEPIGLDVETLPKPVRWSDLFGNDCPVELEIGIGKGTFLTEQARARPDVNFFGIEWARWFWRSRGTANSPPRMPQALQSRPGDRTLADAAQSRGRERCPDYQHDRGKITFSL